MVHEGTALEELDLLGRAGGQQSAADAAEDQQGQAKQPDHAGDLEQQIIGHKRSSFLFVRANRGLCAAGAPR